MRAGDLRAPPSAAADARRTCCRSGALVQVERESERRGSGFDTFLVARHLLGRRAILLRNVLGDILSLRRHLRIELERLEVDVGGIIADAFERLFQRSRPITHQGRRRRTRSRSSTERTWDSRASVREAQDAAKRGADSSTHITGFTAARNWPIGNWPSATGRQCRQQGQDSSAARAREPAVASATCCRRPAANEVKPVFPFFSCASQLSRPRPVADRPVASEVKP